MWSSGESGVWKADGRGRSINLFQLLAGKRADDKVTTPLAFTFCLPFCILPLHFQTPSFSVSRSHFSRRHPMYCVTFLNHPVKKRQFTPRLTCHLASNTWWSHIFSKTCDSYNRCTEWICKNNYNFGSVCVYISYICVGELWVCHIASSPHSRRNYECWIKIFTVHSIS